MHDYREKSGSGKTIGKIQLAKFENELYVR